MSKKSSECYGKAQEGRFANGASELENKHKKIRKICCNNEYSML